MRNLVQPGQPLTKREKQVLELTAQGLTDKEIARTLFLGVGTTAKAQRDIKVKLGARSRANAVYLAIAQEGTARHAH